MRYFMDTEFIEDGKTIDLISIGMIAEDGRELYLQNTECRFRRASQWVKENVFPSIRYFDIRRMRPILIPPPHGSPNAWQMWQTRRGIAQSVKQFCDHEKHGKPEFWGYYSAYDHVALCQLFGTMMDLPKGWPMYTRDIKQFCDALGNPRLPEQGKGEHDALQDAKWNKVAWEFLTGYHHA